MCIDNLFYSTHAGILQEGLYNEPSNGDGGIRSPSRSKKSSKKGGLRGIAFQLEPKLEPGILFYFLSESSSNRKSMTPMNKIPFSSLYGIIWSLTITIFLKESWMRFNEWISCSYFSLESTCSADWSSFVIGINGNDILRGLLY